MENQVREFSVNRAWLVVGFALFATASAYGAASLASLIDEVMRKGPASQLPAHLSMVLGLSVIEQPTAVKQAVLRDGDTVRTFNVCTANHSDVVMITYNEKSRSSKAYLVSPAGNLRKAVSFKAGAPATERSPREAGADFAAEIKFWTNLQGQFSAPH
jgi:hypothetical protein